MAFGLTCPSPPLRPPRHGYFLSLPSREYLPALWSEDELQQLQGTGLLERAVADRCGQSMCQQAAASYSCRLQLPPATAAGIRRQHAVTPVVPGLSSSALVQQRHR